MKFNENLILIRKEKNLSQLTVAKAINVTVSCYSNYEQGIREPNIEMIIKLCKFFDVSSDFLLGLSEY
jgi:transcriptional regulator with XRE-family HTH domain